MNKRYFSLYQEGTEAHLDIYGDITSWPWLESDVSSYLLSRQLAELVDVSTIYVHINSYGGEIAEGLAIYNALKRHKAKIVTTCDGFACSISSVIFMAGDDRIMCDASLLMIHNPWTLAAGNAEELRKTAGDLDVMATASIAAYMACVNITEEEVVALMDAETWIGSMDATLMGFATSIEDFVSDKPTQSARAAMSKKLLEEPKQYILDTPVLAVSEALDKGLQRLFEQLKQEHRMNVPIDANPQDHDPTPQEEPLAFENLCRFISIGVTS